MDILKIPPNNMEAEQSVIGAMLLDKNAISSAAEILRGEDFYKEAHGRIFDTIIELYNRDEPVDLVTLVESLRTKGILDAIGGLTYLSNLAASVPTTANIKYYAKIVEEKSTLRNLIKTSSELMDKCYSENDEVPAILESAEKAIFDISQKAMEHDFEPISKVLERSFDNIEKLYKSKGELTGVPTGFVDLDRKTSGMQKGDMILVAARPSMGKTAFAINIGQYAATRHPYSVAIFSLEMSKEQLVQRMLCSEANIDMLKLRTGNLEDEDWAKLARSAGPLASAKIFIDDSPGISITEMRSKCRRLKIEHGLDLIIIDYLQLMQGKGKTENRQQEVSEISRSLKALAKEMESPVIALSQLSRAPEARADHRPMLSDLRESGSIEQDADVVCFLYRDEYYNKETDKKNIAEVIIAKQRNGPTGTVELFFNGQYTKFSSLDRSFGH
ncbi:replicative DNA helicase [Oxobacter pfennigii]|uniref:Replicative DNA helicase n=1 Tax=Oxobacter pfennigii TaxID=36849 RepID=A0A0P8WKM9_9CLOT|nr:replicative DNA helicase [Oxobacter pfennigii]KPU42897.1 replicative DNA helicase [Oxobacter pfennigii]